MVKDVFIFFFILLIFLFGSVCVVIYLLVFYSLMCLLGVVIGIVVFIVSVLLFVVFLEYFLSKKFVFLKWFISFVFGVFGIGMLVMGKVYDVMVLLVFIDD